MPDLTFEKVLIVLPKQKADLEDIVRDILDDAAVPGSPPTGAFGAARHSDRGPPVVMRNEVDALAEARKGVDLIITHIEIPRDRKTALDATAHRGLALVQSLRKDPDSRIGTTPVVILAEALAATVDDEIEGIEHCESARLGLGSDAERGVTTGETPGGFEADLRWALMALSRGRPTEKISVEIELQLDELHDRPPEQLWTIRTAVGSNRFEPASGSSQFNLKRLRELARDANTFDATKIHQEDYPLWERKLRRIGNQLRKELFADPGFERAFNKARRRAGGMSNMAIRFTIREELHPALLEALVEDRQDAPFWMEEASVCRRLRTKEGTVTVPAGLGKPINTLIVEADLGPSAKHRLGGVLRTLRNLAPECENLYQLVMQRVQCEPSGSFSAPVRVTGASVRNGNASFRDELEHQLTSGTWDLVHLSGHHYLDTAGQKGGFFVPGKEPGDVDCISLDDIAKWLSAARTRLLYLSSCHNSSDQMVLALAEAVPTIVGFRWDIPDDQAISFTARFYEELLTNSGSLCAAFRGARRSFAGSATDRKKQAWAASMLVLEPDDLVFQPSATAPPVETPAPAAAS